MGPKPHNVCLPQSGDARHHEGREARTIYSTIFGIDSHARTATICAFETETGITAVCTFRRNVYALMAEWMAKFCRRYDDFDLMR